MHARRPIFETSLASGCACHESVPDHNRLRLRVDRRVARVAVPHRGRRPPGTVVVAPHAPGGRAVVLGIQSPAALGREAVTAPHVDCEQHHACFTVPDVRAAVEFYTNKLGFRSNFIEGDPPRFAGVTLDRVQIFLERGTPAPGGTSAYFMVGNADELYAFHRTNGVEITVPPEDRAYGLRDYGIRDLNGYRLSFGHPIYTTGDPIEIERVDVPVRLEKRLAAALEDL